uniref:Ovule protein n=1 Tax=Toxocara canis TaxID=6265 RepID=A0A183TXI2_TOXCA
LSRPSLLVGMVEDGFSYSFLPYFVKFCLNSIRFLTVYHIIVALHWKWAQPDIIGGYALQIFKLRFFIIFSYKIVFLHEFIIFQC